MVTRPLGGVFSSATSSAGESFAVPSICIYRHWSSHSSFSSSRTAPISRGDAGFVREDAGDVGAPFDFLVEALERVGGMQFGVVLGREGHVGEHVVLAVNPSARRAWANAGAADRRHAAKSDARPRRQLQKSLADRGGNHRVLSLRTRANQDDIGRSGYCGRPPVQSLSKRRALPFSSFSVSSGPSGSVFSHSVPGGFSANG
jgi:hypothetical protein